MTPAWGVKLEYNKQLEKICTNRINMIRLVVIFVKIFTGRDKMLVLNLIGLVLLAWTRYYPPCDKGFIQTFKQI
jgi:hypothetical protein